MNHFLRNLVGFAVLSIPALAVDGVTLINQATVTAAGGFPYVISQPGSYRLSGNLVVLNATAISITASNVTLDLNGFSITCQSCSATNGIVSSGDTTTVVNGAMSGFPNTGIWFQGRQAVADRLTLLNNQRGIRAASDLTVTNSTIGGSSGVGIQDDGGILVLTNCRITANAGGGATLMTSGSTALISFNVFVNNGTASNTLSSALTLSGGAVVNSNVFQKNANSAIRTSGGPLVYSSNTFDNASPVIGTSAVSGGNNACLVGGITQLC